MRNPITLFDSHLHIIDKKFPLFENNGYLPDAFNVEDYLQSTSRYTLLGGAIVSGSFQQFDQTYLIDALAKLGPNYVGVTQLPVSVSDEEIIQLNNAGIRAVRFNLKRGGSEKVEHLVALAQRVYALAKWHCELYVDAAELTELFPILKQLPVYSIDHLGLTKAGLENLYRAVEQGAYVKATGFGRVDFAVTTVMKKIYQINPAALLFGTDLPSTRVPRPFLPADGALILAAFSEAEAAQILHKNALRFYRL